MQDNVTQAEVIVARHIDAWGWGPLDQIEGLAEHKLAVDACAAGLASTAQPEVKALVEALEIAEPYVETMHSLVLQGRDRGVVKTVWNALVKIRAALAAYHEAQP